MKTKKNLLTPEEVLENGKSILKPWTVEEKAPEAHRCDVIIEAASLKACTKALIDAKWGYLAAITALDRAEFEVNPETNEKHAIKDKGNLEVLYHFCSGAEIVTLRVALPYNKASIDTICDIIPSASMYEREAAELLGINFIGTPSTDHLLLPDGWPKGIYPLRKTFTGLSKKQKLSIKED
jgi:NADH:ubiquinone oxidoreductase subunit C